MTGPSTPGPTSTPGPRTSRPSTSGPSAPPTGPQGPRTGLIVAIVVGAVVVLLVLVLIVVLAAVFAVRAVSRAEAAKPAAPEEQVTALATQYMDSLAQGDPGPALDLVGSTSVAGATPLPEEVYSAALEKAPIADVSVGEPQMSALSGEVSVEYTVGGEPASGTIHAADDDDDGTYELVTALDYDTDVPAQLSGLPVTINGGEVEPGTRYVVLPGAYEVAIDHELFDLEGERTLTYTAAEEPLEWPEPALNDAGQKEFRTAVSSAVDECLDQKSLKAGCGMGTITAESADGWKATEGTVERSLSETGRRTVDTMEATPDSEEATFVSGSVVGTVKATMGCTKGQQKGTCELMLGGSMTTPSVDLADEEHPVTWD